MTTTTIRVYDAVQDAEITVEKVRKSDAEWRSILSEKEYQITAKKGTEAPGERTFAEIHEPGIFRCVRCGLDLFKSSTKFESGTGWPSFYAPVSPLNVVLESDYSLGMLRMEVMCARCGSHLGHVFDDGPPPTGKRYCMNGYALKFKKE